MVNKDGIILKLLEIRLATNWQQPYSKTYGYVKSWFVITMVWDVHCYILIYWVPASHNSYHCVSSAVEGWSQPWPLLVINNKTTYLLENTSLVLLGIFEPQRKRLNIVIKSFHTPNGAYSGCLCYIIYKLSLLLCGVTS